MFVFFRVKYEGEKNVKSITIKGHECPCVTYDNPNPENCQFLAFLLSQVTCSNCKMCDIICIEANSDCFPFPFLFFQKIKLSRQVLRYIFFHLKSYSFKLIFEYVTISYKTRIINHIRLCKNKIQTYTNLHNLSILSYLSSKCRHDLINYAGVQIGDDSSLVGPSLHTLAVVAGLVVGEFSGVSLVSVEVGAQTLAQIGDAAAQRPQHRVRSARVPLERAAL